MVHLSLGRIWIKLVRISDKLVGLFAAMRGSAITTQLNLTDPYTELLRNVNLLLDAYAWKPLLSEWDYEDSSRRIHAFLDRELEVETPESQ